MQKCADALGPLRAVLAGSRRERVRARRPPPRCAVPGVALAAGRGRLPGLSERGGAPRRTAACRRGDRAGDGAPPCRRDRPRPVRAAPDRSGAFADVPDDDRRTGRSPPLLDAKPLKLAIDVYDLGVAVMAAWF